MHSTGLRSLAFVICFAIVGVCVRAAELPPAFSDVTLDAAKKQVEGTDKVVVIKFTAEWCGPCKAMDKTTWRDDDVVKWVKDNGVAIQVDVDKDRKTAEAYNIEAMPTMVMLRGSKEIARTLGYMDPAQTLAWMESAATGKAPAAKTAPRKAEAELSAVGKLMADLQKNVAEKKYGESIAIVQQMWSDANANDPMRQVGLVPDIREDLVAILAGAPDSRAAFIAIRDGIEKAEDDGTVARVGRHTDWLAWNSVLGDDARSLAWLDRERGTESGAAWISIGMAEIAPILIRNKRADQIPELFPDAADRLRKRYGEISPSAKSLSVIDPPRGARAWAEFENVGAQVFAGFVAAKDLKDANVIAEVMLQLRDTPTMRVALVRESLNAGAIGPGANLWLDEAEASGQRVSELRARLAALQKK
ncbi:MAG: thioredoxin fold domain-containing protein [Phycisphaeraceae bacterium]|nr:thioredoxin fold domain-containing protein [Phycisphaeraceae bacterium]